MDVLAKPVESTVTTDAANATATATLAASGLGFKWRITDFWASFDGAAVGTPVACTLTVGGVTYKFGIGTSGPLMANLACPMESSTNEAPSLSLAAGGIGANGHVGLSAFKVPVLPANVTA